jgi:hypothetical protein
MLGGAKDVLPPPGVSTLQSVAANSTPTAQTGIVSRRTVVSTPQRY